jgi:hypothetical protein
VAKDLKLYLLYSSYDSLQKEILLESGSPGGNLNASGGSAIARRA